jgi:hypothetical protein
VRESSFMRDARKALHHEAGGFAFTPMHEARTRQLIDHFGRDLLWRHPQSRVAENAHGRAMEAVRQAAPRLLPNARQDPSSPRSGLATMQYMLLPPVS